MRCNISEAGISLLEVGLFLVVLGSLSVSFVEVNSFAHYIYSSWGFSEQMRQDTLFFKDYLTKEPEALNYGVSEISPLKIVPSDYINDNGGVDIDGYSIRFYAIKEKIGSLNTDDVSGLITANPVDEKKSFPKNKVYFIESMLRKYGGVVDNNKIKGNLGGWILDLNKLTGVKQPQIVAYIPSIFFSANASPPGTQQIGDISYRICNMGKCDTALSHLPITKDEVIKWMPLYFDDCVTISFTETNNIDYYVVSIFDGNRKLIKTMVSKSDFVLEPFDFLNGSFDIEIKPVSSMFVGRVQKLTLVKSLPEITVSDLWKSFNISIAVDNNADLNHSDNASSQIKKNGKLISVNFTPNQNKWILYDLRLEFCGNDFVFPKKSTLNINYYNAQFEPWFLLKKNNSANNDNDPQRVGNVFVCFDPLALESYQLNDGNIFIDNQLISKENLGKQGVFETPLDRLTNSINIIFPVR